MSSSTDLAVRPIASSETPAQAVRRLVTAHPYETVVLAIVLAQAAWLGYLMAGGWFYQADFDNLAVPAQSSLTWSYLTASQGGHLGLVGGLCLWLMQRAFGLTYWPSIGLRLIGQALATALLARLLIRLCGRQPLVLAVLIGYSASPLLVPGISWLTSSISLVIYQPLFLIAIGHWLRYNREARLRSAGYASALLLFGTITYDGALAMLFTLPLLSLGWGYVGRRRLRSLVRQWLGWVLLLGPQLVYGMVVVFGGYASAAAEPVSIGGYLRLIGTSLGRVVTPSLVGGPWSWSTPGDNYLAFADPSVAVELLGALAWVALLLIGLRRVGRRAVLALALPWVAATAMMVLVGAGRFNAFGTITALAYRYNFVLAIPLALGVALALSREEQPEEAIAGTRPGSTGADSWTPRRRLPIVFTVLVLASSVLSGVTFRSDWSRSPARAWVLALTRGVHQQRSANVYDVYVPNWLIPAVEKNRHVSDLLSIDGGPALNQFGTRTTLPGRTGSLVPAQFLPIATASRPIGRPCIALIKGIGSWTIPLPGTPRANEWFIRVEYYEGRPSKLSMAVQSGGQMLAPASGSELSLLSRLDAFWLRLPNSTPRALVVSSHAATTSVCFTKVQLGYPFARPAPP